MGIFNVFYFVLFGTVGMFNILAGVLDWKWYIDYWLRQRGRPGQKIKSRMFLRVCISLIGAVFLLYGIAALVGWI